MLNKVGIKVRLVRSKDAFCLMGDTSAETRDNTCVAVCTKGENITLGVRRPCPRNTEQQS